MAVPRPEKLASAPGNVHARGGGNLWPSSLVSVSGGGGPRETARRKRSPVRRQRRLPVRPVPPRLFGAHPWARPRKRPGAPIPPDEGGEPEDRGRRSRERLLLHSLRLRLRRAALRLVREGAARDGPPQIGRAHV